MSYSIWDKHSLTTRFIFSLKESGFKNTIRRIITYLWRNILCFTYPVSFCFLNKKKSFYFKKRRYFYCREKYNLSWRNERAIEIPIFQRLIRENSKANILEVGCVLKRYKSSTKSNWTIVDKFEKFGNTLNLDIIDYNPRKKFDLILSISTIEHIGLEDGSSEKNKVTKAINHIVTNCLSKNGKFIFSIPIGYNKYLDHKIFSKRIHLSKVYFFKKCKNNDWVEVDREKVVDCEYNKYYRIGARGLLIGIIDKGISK